MSWHGDDGVNGPRAVWADDDELALDLAAALADAELVARVEAAGMPALRLGRRLAALTDELDLLLLELVHDSLDHDALVAVRDRSGDAARSLVFEGAGVGVEVELTDDQVEGQLIPAGPGRVSLRGPQGEIADVATDEVGYFRLEVRPHGPVQLVCRRDAGACATRWLSW
jgi:hypothetical protein